MWLASNNEPYLMETAWDYDSRIDQSLADGADPPSPTIPR
jgi:hypothetical protein